MKRLKHLGNELMNNEIILKLRLRSYEPYKGSTIFISMLNIKTSNLKNLFLFKVLLPVLYNRKYTFLGGNLVSNNIYENLGK